MSIKDTIRNRKRTIITEPVPTPEWPDVDGTVCVRKLSARQQDDWEADILIVDGKLSKTRDFKNIRAKFAVLCACDKDGVLLFDSEDADWIGDEDVTVVDRLWEAGRKLSGISDKDNEELAKN